MCRDMLSPVEGAVRGSLRCPVCRALLDDVADGSGGFVCTEADCATFFPVVDDIPILINEERSVFSRSGFVSRRRTYFEPRGDLLERVERLLPDIQRPKAKRRFDQLVQLLLERTARPLVLVVGGGVEGRGIDPLLQAVPPITLVETDVSLAPRTTAIVDAHDIPFADDTFDGVVAQAVLEHVLDPVRVVSEIHRVLKPGGVVYAQTPFMQQVHGGAFDYTRYTLLGHRRLFNAFEEIDSGAGNGPGAALAWSWQYFLLSFATAKIPRAALRAVAKLSAFWLKYIDVYLERKPGALDAATGFYFIGSKSGTRLPDLELIKQYRGGLTG
jgi:SAM-dependent methyltransferase